MEKISGLGSVCVRLDDGTINIEATLEGVAEQLVALAEQEANDSVRIASAVGAVFDLHLGKVLTMPALVNAALGHLTFTPETFAAVSEQVAEYVRNNKATYSITKGKGGGVRRICDTPAKG